MEQRETVAQHAGAAAGRDAYVPEQVVAQPHGGRRLEHVPRQRGEARPKSEDPGHVGRPGVAAAVLAHILAPAQLAQKQRRTQRAEQIAHNDYDHIFHKAHNDTSLTQQKVVLIIRPVYGYFNTNPAVFSDY